MEEVCGNCLDDAHASVPAARAELDGRVLAGPGDEVGEVLDDRGPVVERHDLGDREAQQLAGRPAEYRLERRHVVVHRQVAVDHGDHVGGVLDESAGAPLAAALAPHHALECERDLRGQRLDDAPGVIRQALRCA